MIYVRHVGNHLAHIGTLQVLMEAVVYVLYTSDKYYCTQYERVVDTRVEKKSGKWLRTYVWEVQPHQIEIDEPFIYNFVRNPLF